MEQPTKEDICAFVGRARTSRTNHTLTLCQVDLSTSLKIKQTLPLTLNGYHVIITEEYVRHVKNGHKHDVDYICLIPEIISHFDTVSKTIEPNRRTGRTEIFVVFGKKYPDGTVKLVKLRDMREKTLSLKTLFRKD